tara:strand:+ start:917 stop:1906 length:990 start_codon:yes stop_codon:yes gene_type:complete
MKKYTYIDLFSGAGGFSLGFDKENFINIFSNDNEPSFCETYTHNFPKHLLVNEDIQKLSSLKIKKLIKKNIVDVVIGGPPCQGFSIAGNIGRKFIDDPRNHLFKEFSRVVKIVKPKIIVMENVARLFTHNKGGTKKEIIETFNKLGYKTEARIIDSSKYGVPQVRNRVFFIGRKDNGEIIFPKEVSKRSTTGMAISKYPSLKSGQKSKIPNHQAMNHTDQMLKKMKYVSQHGNRNEIPKKYRPTSGDVRKYIRYKKNEPSITITGDMRKVFHYSQNRALTVRELAALQTFPDSFLFKGNSISQQMQVGNAVPPLLAKHVAKAVRLMLSE